MQDENAKNGILYLKKALEMAKESEPLVPSQCAYNNSIMIYCPFQAFCLACMRTYVNTPLSCIVRDLCGLKPILQNREYYAPRKFGAIR